MMMALYPAHRHVTAMMISAMAAVELVGQATGAMPRKPISLLMMPKSALNISRKIAE
jgi:hypothetical protein